MKIVIIGSSSSGLFLSLYLKIFNKNLDVLVIEKNNIIAKKMYATGNGRCNITNLLIDENFSFNSIETFNIYKEFDSISIINFLKDKLGIYTINIDNYIYPFSLSAKSFVDLLINKAEEYGIKFNLNEEFIDYKKENGKFIIKTDKNMFSSDYLVFASGNSSSPKLGEGLNILNCLKNHSYLISDIKAGLTPLKINEKINEIENERLKTNLTLFINNKKYYSEKGEVLFKNDRLSGIVSFNISSIIKRYLLKNKSNNIYLSLDFLPEINEDELTLILEKNQEILKEKYLNGIFSYKISKFLNKKIANNNIKKDYPKISKLVKNIKFNYKYDDDFINSQVSVGGLEFSNLTDDLMSKKEKNLFFVGEMLNADGLCGGYNISFAFASSKKVGDFILKNL